MGLELFQKKNRKKNFMMKNVGSKEKGMESPDLRSFMMGGRMRKYREDGGSGVMMLTVIGCVEQVREAWKVFVRSGLMYLP